MSKARHYTLEELQLKQQRISRRQAHLVESAKRAAAREKALKKKIARQESDERLKRLNARGELLESLIENASQLTNERLSQLLTFALSQPAVIAAIRKMTVPLPSSGDATNIERNESTNE